MSVEVMAWVWKHSLATGTDRIILLAIADHAGDDGTNAYPSVATLGSKCALSRRTVQRSIARLVELGELEVEDQKGGGSWTRSDRRPNRYRVVMNDGASIWHPVEDGASPVHDGASGVQGKHADGASAVTPEPSFNHPEPSAPNLALVSEAGAVISVAQARANARASLQVRTKRGEVA